MHKLQLTKRDGRVVALRTRPYSGNLTAPSPDGLGNGTPNAHLRWHPRRGECVASASHRQNRTFLPAREYNPPAPTTDATGIRRSGGDSPQREEAPPTSRRSSKLRTPSTPAVAPRFWCLRARHELSGRSFMETTLFRSFFMGGFECSTHRLRSGRRLDVLGATAHDRFARQDYHRLASVGMRTVRDGLRWHLIEPSPGVYDFSGVLPMLAAARDADVEVIWDLLHYGWPDDLDIFSDAFVDRFAELARVFVELATRQTNGPLWIVPVNEISFFAWAGGDVGIFNPFATHRGDELKRQLVRATIAAIASMRQVNPEVRIVHTEPMINVVPHANRPHEAAAAECHREAQYAALDMIAGRTHPELGGREDYLGCTGRQLLHPQPMGLARGPRHHD